MRLEALCAMAMACLPACLCVSAGDLTGGRWGPFWDKLVFSKIRERVGGEVKYMTTGAGSSHVEYGSRSSSSHLVIMHDAIIIMHNAVLEKC